MRSVALLLAIKLYDGCRFFLCKGKEKVAAKTSLMLPSYNIRRAISIAGGVQKLITRLTEAKTRTGTKGKPCEFEGNSEEILQK